MQQALKNTRMSPMIYPGLSPVVAPERPRFLNASRDPLEDLQAIAYQGQHPKMMMYRSGYEAFFEQLPLLTDNDPVLQEKIQYSSAVMAKLAAKLMEDIDWIKEKQPSDGDFARTIISMESPSVDDKGVLHEGKELLVAHWGKGFSSPVHGHAPGFEFEQLLYGKIMVNTYLLLETPGEKDVVIPVMSKIYTGFSNIVSSYAVQLPDQKYKRQSLIHNFVTLEPSASLHWVSEHTRDGRDNSFPVQQFHDVYRIDEGDVTRLTAQEGIQGLRIGDVALVRSSNVPEYGDHYIVITGAPILKHNGLRPQETAIAATGGVGLLDRYEDNNGLVLLKLNSCKRNKFLQYHGIRVEGKTVIFPNP